MSLLARIFATPQRHRALNPLFTAPLRTFSFKSSYPRLLKQPSLRIPPYHFSLAKRLKSSTTKPNQIKIDKPTYQLTFTCKACTARSSHLVSKQAYSKGTVLVQCPKCQNRHLIADHLNVFGGGKRTLEDILSKTGTEKIKYGQIDPKQLGDIEWETGDHPELIG